MGENTAKNSLEMKVCDYSVINNHRTICMEQLHLLVYSKTSNVFFFKEKLTYHFLMSLYLDYKLRQNKKLPT